MTDLSFCHLHMTNRDMLIFGTFENPNTYLSGELSDEELEVPPHEIPPNPDDSDILPSQVHPSYPYGNPTNIKHPANHPRKPTDSSSRALFSDTVYAGGGTNGALRWRDLALDRLLPIDHARDEAKRAALARKMASGSGPNNGPGTGQVPIQHAEPGQQTEESDENDDDEESDDIDSGSIEDEDEDENENVEANYDDELN